MKQVLDSDRKIRTVCLLKYTDVNLAAIETTAASTADDCTPGQSKDDKTADAIVDSLKFEQKHRPTANDAAITY